MATSRSWEEIVEQAKKDYIEAGEQILNNKSLFQRYTPDEMNEIMRNMIAFSSKSSSAEQQYLTILKNCYENGTNIVNERTGSICRTILNQRIQFDGNEFPLLTTRKMYWKQAIGEMVAYIRAYTDLREFHKLGVHTWNANVDTWNSGHKLCKYDAGIIYGSSAKMVGFGYEELLQAIKLTPNDRGLIWNFWNPAWFAQGCLRPCMYNHQFNVLDDTLHLTSTQRSCDWVLGGAFNLVQCWFLLNITAKLTGLKVGTITWNIANVHIYENQLPFVPEQLSRQPKQVPSLKIKDSLDFDVLNEYLNKDNFDEYFELQNYDSHPAIKYPFTV